MCGIAGFWGKNDKWMVEINAMCDRIVHRGPDAMGIWSEENTQIVLGHRRLSIVDLSKNGKQPMQSQNGRYVISYNGEIYNYQEIIEELQYKNIGYHFVSKTDTEILLEAIAQWGLRETLQKVRGMFAFALFDREEDSLYLVRDRIGEKPLYYGKTRARFVFASDLASLECLEDFGNKVSPEALKIYFQHGYIPAPYSIYEGIYKLEPGTFVTVRNMGETILRDCYWSAEKMAIEGQNNLFKGSEEEAAEELERLLKESIKLQMLADVPVGAFLSAGIDSSTTVALMQELSQQPVKTFTIGVESAQYNEAIAAKEIAQRLGTDHTEWYISPYEARQVIPQLGYYYSEPFADSSQIPTMLVSKLARQRVTVALSGDGGDELFAGYNFYEYVKNVWEQITRFPRILRRPGGWVARNMPLLKNTKMARSGSVLSCKTPEELYNWMRTGFFDGKILTQNPKVYTQNDLCEPWIFDEKQQNIMLMDLIMYHPDDILVKVDRAAMAFSLETRIPMLDVKVVEFAWSVPFDYKKKSGVTKKVLRDVLYKYVPKELMERPKAGFSIPLNEWLQNDLKDWGENLIYSSELEMNEILRQKIIRQMWEKFCKDGIWTETIWRVLVLAEWMGNKRGSD